MTLYPQADVVPVNPGVVPSALSGVTTDQYLQFAFVTVLAYDTITTFDKEVKHFWKMSRTSINVVYFAIRYIGLVGAISILSWHSFIANTTLCNFAQWIRSLAVWTTVNLIDYILMIRVLALYSDRRDKKLPIALKVLFISSTLAKLAISLYITSSDKIVVAGLGEDITTCAVVHVATWRWTTVDWAISLTYGVLLMVLALYKAAEYWKVSAGLKGFPLVGVLIQDQFVYFLCVIVVSLINSIGSKIPDSNPFVNGLLRGLGNPFFLSVLGSRMLVNLREAAERGQNQGTNYRTQSATLSGMEFA